MGWLYATKAVRPLPTVVREAWPDMAWFMVLRLGSTLRHTVLEGTRVPLLVAAKRHTSAQLGSPAMASWLRYGAPLMLVIAADACDALRSRSSTTLACKLPCMIRNTPTSKRIRMTASIDTYHAVRRRRARSNMAKRLMAKRPAPWPGRASRRDQAVAHAVDGLDRRPAAVLQLLAQV